MATRFYPTASIIADPPEITPAFSAGWEKTAGATRLALQPVIRGGTTAYGITGTGVSGNDVLILQLISDPLPKQVIEGTVKGQMFAAESSAANDYRPQTVIKVVSKDGTTVRGVLLDFDVSALSSEFNTPGIQSRKFPLAASSPATLTPITLIDGDRIVVELGYRQHSTAVADGSITLSEGTDDLPENETDTDSLFNSCWIEFSQTIRRFKNYKTNGARLTGSVLTSSGSWVGGGETNTIYPSGVLPGRNLSYPAAIYGISYKFTTVPALDVTNEFMIQITIQDHISLVSTIVAQLPVSIRADTLVGYYLGYPTLHLPEPFILKPEDGLSLELFASAAIALHNVKVMYRELEPSLLPAPRAARNTLLRR